MGSYECTVTVPNVLGIHVRPSNIIQFVAKKFKADVKITNEGVTADAKSINSLLMLQAVGGSEVKISAVGIDAKEACLATKYIIETGFGEELM